ncbi:MAG: helix-turn-helix transcriptional regulator [Polyangiaceae bacterium]|nr:helix-turn-helix transcriptional regulator [Polyangiaceae bacterium]
MASSALPLWSSSFHVPSEPRLVSRDIVLWLDSGASSPRAAEATWSALMSGERRVVDAFCDNARAYLVLERRTVRVPQAEALLPRYVEMLKRLLSGQSQKAISIDLGVTPSTVALSLSRCMARLGLACRAQNLPLALALLGQAANFGLPTADVRVSCYEAGQLRYEIVSVARPDLGLPSILSTAEQAVARQVLEGTTHTEAAELRGTSRRTIANQLSAIFRKLGVSGRFELMRRLQTASFSQARPVPAPPLASTAAAS